MDSRAAQVADLLREHGDSLALYAAQWTSEPEDCVQEALVEYARQRHTPDSPVAWLYRVVKRRALNTSRSDARRRGRETEAFRRRLRVSAGAPDPAQSSALADGVARLEASLRETLVLRVWGGLTFEEIGNAVGASTSTAARRFESALAALRAEWLPDDNDPSPVVNRS